MILMVLIWEQFTKFNVLDDTYDVFADLYFHIALCFIFRYIVQCSIMVNELQSKFSDQAQKTLQFILLRSLSKSFGDIYKS